jgi:hypothetical protein
MEFIRPTIEISGAGYRATALKGYATQDKLSRF